MPTGGIARYTLELASALARTFPNDQYWLLSDQPLPQLPSDLHVGGRPRNLIERRWWTFGLNREMDRHSVELFHGTDYSVPYLRKRPAVITVHDLSPWKYPQWQPAAGRIRRRTPRLLKAGCATAVITLSHAIKQEVVEFFQLPADRVFVVPLAADTRFEPTPAPAPTRPYFLFVGTLEPRKNLHALIDAWRPLSHQVDLVLAGRTRADFDLPKPEPGLRLTGAVPEADLPGLYTNATAVIYPSHYEGFGLPVLEAMRCGALVITSSDPAIRETAGGTAIHTSDWRTAMQSVIERPHEFEGLRERARKRALEYSWERTARATREVYEAARALS